MWLQLTLVGIVAVVFVVRLVHFLRIHRGTGDTGQPPGQRSST